MRHGWKSLRPKDHLSGFRPLLVVLKHACQTVIMLWCEYMSHFIITVNKIKPAFKSVDFCPYYWHFQLNPTTISHSYYLVSYRGFKECNLILFKRAKSVIKAKERCIYFHYCTPLDSLWFNIHQKLSNSQSNRFQVEQSLCA